MGGAVSSGRDNDELIDNLMRGNYIRRKSVEQVFRALDRADYMVPESRDQAYKDLAWRYGLLHMSAPCIYSAVMEGLELKPGLSFLNVGSGTGYLSTLVGLILGSAGINHGVEIHSVVVEYAKKKISQFLENSPVLDDFDFCEPKFYCGDGLNLAPLQSPYDRVYCGAGCPMKYQFYFKQLIKVGGILIMPIEDHLLQIRRVSQMEWVSASLLNVSFASLRVPNNTDAVEPLKLDEQCPPRLQQLCRGTIRSTLRLAALSRHPELREVPRPPLLRSRMPRRLCIPIQDDNDMESLDALHDLDNLDQGSGAQEMNALLSLVLSMGHNRVAGAFRFDDQSTSSSENDADGGEDGEDDDDSHDNNDDPGFFEDYEDDPALHYMLQEDRRPRINNQRNARRQSRAVLQNLAQADQSNQPESNPCTSTDDNVTQENKITTQTDNQTSDNSGDKNINNSKSEKGTIDSDQGKSDVNKSVLDHEKPHLDKSEPDSNNSNGDHMKPSSSQSGTNGGKSSLKRTKNGLPKRASGEGSSGVKKRFNKKSDDDTCEEAYPTEVEIYLGKMNMPGGSTEMEWELIEDTREDDSSDEEVEVSSTTQVEKRQKFDSGIGGESSPCVTSTKTDESDHAETTHRSDSVTDEEPQRARTGARRRIRRRVFYRLNGSSSSTEAEMLEGERDLGDSPPIDEEGEEGTSKKSNKKRGYTADARRVRLSRIMKLSVKELPLPPLMKKYINWGRCYQI